MKKMNNQDFQKLIEEYQKALEAYQNGDLNRNYLFNLGKPCQELLDSGISENDILMFQRKREMDNCGMGREKTTSMAQKKRKRINLRLSASTWQREWFMPFLFAKITNF